MLSITPVIPNPKLLFGNLLLLEEVGISFPRDLFPFCSHSGLGCPRGSRSGSWRSEPWEREHLECWLRNAHGVGESQARHHIGPCQGSDHAIPDSIPPRQEQTSALSLPHPCEIPCGSRALPWSGPGWSLALYWTIQTAGRRPGPAGVTGLGLCGLCWCWAPSWDAPPFPGCVQRTPDRKKLPEELKTIQNTLWIPLPPSVPITSFKGETPKYPFVTDRCSSHSLPCLVQSSKEEE